MKVAVSIPDELSAEADSVAQQLNVSRSEVYSRALSEFLGRHAPDRVTGRMDETLDSLGEETDAFTKHALRRVLERVDW